MKDRRKVGILGRMAEHTHVAPRPYEDLPCRPTFAPVLLQLCRVRQAAKREGAWVLSAGKSRPGCERVVPYTGIHSTNH